METAASILLELSQTLFIPSNPNSKSSQRKVKSKGSANPKEPSQTITPIYSSNEPPQTITPIYSSPDPTDILHPALDLKNSSESPNHQQNHLNYYNPNPNPTPNQPPPPLPAYPSPKYQSKACPSSSSGLIPASSSPHQTQTCNVHQKRPLEASMDPSIPLYPCKKAKPSDLDLKTRVNPSAAVVVDQVVVVVDPKKQVEKPATAPKPRAKPLSTISNPSVVASTVPRSCTNCGSQTTPVWKRDSEKRPICHTCYEYRRIYKKDRPPHLEAKRRAKSVKSSKLQQQQQIKSPNETPCNHCQSLYSSTWNLDPVQYGENGQEKENVDDGSRVCLACFQFYKQHNKVRSLLDVQPLDDAENEGGHAGPVHAVVAAAADVKICINCKCTTTPLWRRDADKNRVCTACYAYFKLYNIQRPEHLIKKLSRSSAKNQ